MQPTQIAPGSVLDQRFQVTEAVASGGMGTVYRALDLLRNETVAVKVLAGRDRMAIGRFEREAQLLQDLRHPGIVRYVAHGVLPGGAPYLAMEWLSGEDLARRMQRQPLTVAETVELGMAVAGALGAAHDSGVIHRDIKPGNLFLPDEQPGRVKLLDFGIARLFGAEMNTRTGTIIGTPDYMAPEQVRGDREIDARADLFSLGCVLFECLTGSPPFASDQMMGVFGKILFEPPPTLSGVRSGLPAELAQLISALLEKDRVKRPARAADVLTTLGRIPISELYRPSPSNPELGTGQPSRPKALTTHEQRLLSIVVVAARPAVSSEAPTVSVSPEQSWLHLVRELAAPFGARTDQLPDGSLLALLTGQPTASDQARQAARLALRIRERWQSAATELPPETARIAVCTGRGDLERGLLDAGSIERASGLIARAGQHSSRDGGMPGFPILLDEMTRGLLDTRFQTAVVANLPLLISEQPIAEPVRLVLGRSTPFFGRERELGLLLAIASDCIAEPQARAALVTAEAGMGKTRLCQEFVQRAVATHNELAVWIGRGDPLGAGSPFALLAYSLRQALALPEGAEPAVQRQRLTKYLDRWLPPGERRRIGEFVGELLLPGLADDEPASEALQAARRDPMLMGDQIRRAVLDLLERECQRRPLIWVLEDLHWGDLPTVRLVDAALRQLAERPFFVLALARPSVHEAFPRLWSERGLQELRLSGLSRKASEKIARAVLGDSQQVEAVLGLLERASGNAFFLEEMLRAAAAGQLDQAPATVLAMVQSRIERLEPQARRVLRAACVFGAVFWRGGVARLLGDQQRLPEVSSWLEVLSERELIARRPDTRFPGEPEYVFVHALVRDAAYAMLTESDRTLGHRLAARYLEEAGERDAVVLAEHWERSGELQRAVAWYRRATWQALEGNDLDAVLRHAERAVACGAAGQELGELRAAQAEASQWRGAYREAIGLARTAMALLPARSERWFQVAGALAIAAGRILEGNQLELLANELLTLAQQGETSDDFLSAAVRTSLQLYIAGDYPRADELIRACDPILELGTQRSPAVEAVIYILRANRAAYAWQLDLCPLYFERAAALYEQIGDLRNAGSQKIDAALFYMDIGRFARTEQLTREIVDVATRLGLGRLLSVARGVLSIALYHLGQHEEAMRIGQLAMDLAVVAGDLRISGFGNLLFSRIAMGRGDLVAAEQYINRALRDLDGMPRFRARALAMHARIMTALERPAEALRSASQSFAILQALGRIGSDEPLIRLAYAAALELFGETRTADEVLRTGRERLLTQAACIADPAARQGFLNLLEHAELLERTEPNQPSNQADDRRREIAHSEHTTDGAT